MPLFKLPCFGLKQNEIVLMAFPVEHGFLKSSVNVLVHISENINTIHNNNAVSY